MRTNKRFLRSGLLWLCAAILVILLSAYPNPLIFFQTMGRFIRLPVDPKAVADVSATLPDDAQQIENWVTANIVHGSDGYEEWGVLAYIATPAETLARRRGPCRARAILLASILEAKGIPNRLYTNVHAWVDYDGRIPAQRWEETRYALLYWEKGRWHFNGFGWLAVAPEQLLYFVKDTWLSFSPPGRIALVLLAAGTAGNLYYVLRRKQRQQKIKKHQAEAPSRRNLS